MLTKSVTERLILASDTNVALQGVSSMQEQLRVALQMLSSSDAQLKDAVCLVQGLRERLDLAEARVRDLGFKPLDCSAGICSIRSALSVCRSWKGQRPGCQVLREREEDEKEE